MILRELRSRFRDAVSGLTEEPEPLLDLIQRTTDPKFGDYQANLAMPLGKQLRRPPREVAAEIVAHLDVAELCQAPEIAGPGFINLRLREDYLAKRLAAAVQDQRLGIPAVERPKDYVIDYSAPNVAKPMHVGHIRSTVIGDSLCRMLKFLGHRVISDNHLGDWGTQFGMILYGYRHFLDRAAYQANPVEELARLYRRVRQLMDAEGEEITPAVLAETARLHAGDTENRRLWQEFLPHCEDEINRIYARLGVKFDYTLGESFYHDRLAGLVDELLQRGIAQESEGAICIFLEGQKVPMIIRKQDGAFLYATTDLATIRYRMESWGPDAILYVVDHRQSLHFDQLFAAARKLGYRDVELEHVSFGTVLGEDGRPFKTREGDTVGLEGLLNEAVRRAAEIVSANDDAKPGGAELSAAERQRIAETVGIAAIKYADLSQNRTSDYVFSYDKMLAMTGNTATYMQYAYARVRSIFAKGGVDVESLRASAAGDAPSGCGLSPDSGCGRSPDRATSSIRLDTPAERALGLEILRFGEALELALADYRPNQLTAYLFELANCYSTFFESCPVLRADSAEVRQSRLLLCDLTARALRQGLELLGINVVDRM